MAFHVRFNSLYISLAYSAKQQREMTNSALFGEREPRRQGLKPLFPFVAVSQIQFCDSFVNNKQSKWLKPWFPFLEAPGNLPGPLSCFVSVKDEKFTSFENGTVKLSGKETK